MPPPCLLNEVSYKDKLEQPKRENMKKKKKKVNLKDTSNDGTMNEHYLFLVCF